MTCWEILYSVLARVLRTSLFVHNLGETASSEIRLGHLIGFDTHGEDRLCSLFNM